MGNQPQYGNEMLEYLMKKQLRKKITESDRAAYKVAGDEQFSEEEVWEYLENTSMTMTAGLVLRRHLQRAFPNRFGGREELLNKANAPWDEQTLKALSAFLEKESNFHGLELRKKDWSNYLLDKRMPQKRETALKIILVTQMNMDTALDFLLACTMEPFSAREVWDSIVMFCVQTPGRYTWNDVCKMEEDYQIGIVLARRAGIRGAVEKIDKPMTQWLPVQMDAHKEKTKEEAMADIVRDMVSRYREFWDRNPSLPQHNGTILSEQIDADGFSMGHYLAYRRLAQYLSIFYNWYETEHWHKYDDMDAEKKPERYARTLVHEMEKKRNKPKGTKEERKRQKEFLDYLELHQDDADRDCKIPTFGSLYKALLFHGGLVTRGETATQSSNARSKKISISCAADEIVQWANTLEDRMYSVDRILTGGEKRGFFQRRDALLFVYFFLHAYSSWLLAEEEDELLSLKEKYVSEEEDQQEAPGTIKANYLDAVYALYKDVVQEMESDGYEPESERNRTGAGRMDWAMAMACYEHLEVIPDAKDATLSERMEIFHICFNYLLQGLGHTGLYLPNRLDRALLMALTRGDSLEALLPEVTKKNLTTFKVKDH